MQLDEQKMPLIDNTMFASHSYNLLESVNYPIPKYFNQKVILTRMIGIIFFIIAIPFILFFALLVSCFSPGLGIYWQRRIGKNGKEFTIYKIRTMRNNAEKETGPVWSKPDDSRYCRIGKLLRFLHLDELPQLYNVACGEMDLVGPRPERPELIDDLIIAIPGYRERYRVLPGITGLAQINVPSDVNFDSVRAKLVLDEEYIRTASLWLDIRIILCSALRMFGFHRGSAVRWFGLERRVPKSNPCQADTVRESAGINDNNIVQTVTHPKCNNTAISGRRDSDPLISSDAKIIIPRDGNISGSTTSTPGIGNKSGPQQIVPQNRADTVDV
ncbi:MAG: sugar transferase [Pirellulales bacterium]|nr:sugar transferase [Pirellulales bacterium]